MRIWPCPGLSGGNDRFVPFAENPLPPKGQSIRGISLNVTFHGTLREDQRKAADDMMRHDTGVLAATTAFGKTVLAAWMIAERGVNTLVLVHRRQLMEQWVERLGEFLQLDSKEIGCLGGGRRKLKGKIDIALLQSVVRKGWWTTGLRNTVR
jgi:superfamily II DNA or RNA helicase